MDSLATSLRAAVPGVRLVDSDPFRHVCQLYADDLVILADSQAHLQRALDVVHEWGLRWRFSFGVGPTKSAVMVFGPLRGRPDCSVHLGGVSLPLVPQYRYLGVTLTPSLSWGPHVDLVCARGDRLFHQACAWCRGEGLPLSFSSSVFVTYVLSSSSFGLEFVGDDSRHFSNSTSHSVAGAVIFLGGPVLLLSQQSTGSWVSPMHSALPSDVLSRCLVACVPWTTPPLVLQTLPVSSGSLPPCKAHGRTGARPLFVPFQSHILATLAFLWAPLLRPSDVGSLAKPFPVWTATCASGLQPWLPTCMVCVSLSLLTTSSLPGRTRSTHSTSLPPRCACGGLLVGVTTSPPQAAPPATSLGLPLAPSAMMWTVLSHITSPPAPPTSMLVQLGLTLAASHRPMFQCLHGTAGCSTQLDELNTPQTIRAHIRFVGLVCERLQPPSW